MKTLIFIFGVVLYATAAIAVAAPKWSKLSTDVIGTTAWIENNTLKATPPFIDAWIDFNLKRPARVQGFSYDDIITKERYNCNDHTFIISHVAFFLGKKQVSSSSLNTISQDIVRGSLRENIFETLCIVLIQPRL